LQLQFVPMMMASIEKTIACLPENVGFK
jgi:hypothetical protein